MKKTTYLKSFFLEKEFRRWVNPIGCLLFLLMGQIAFAQGYVTLGTQEVQSGNLNPGVTNGYYESRKIQIVYTAAELNSGGAAAGNIQRLAWDVSALYAGAPLPNYTIRMGHITTGTIPTTTFITGLTVVKNSYSYTPALGFNDITFDTPFNWNGTDNVVVDVCFSAAPYTSPYGQTWNYTDVANVFRSRQADGSNLCTETTANQTYSTKPRVRFYMQLQPPCTGAPVAGTVTTALDRFVCNTALPGVITVAGAQAAAVPGITQQWEQSTDGGVTWVNAVGGTGATTASYTPPAFNGTNIKYRLRVTCTNSNESSYSAVTNVNNPAAPATQAGITASATTTTFNSFSITFTAGSGTRRLVIVSTTPITDPVNGNSAAITAAAAFANNGQQIVYDGTGTTVTVTGLTCNTPYFVKVYEYTRCGSGPYDYYYNTTTGTNTTTVTTSQPALAMGLPVTNNFAGFTGDNLSTVFPGWYEAAIASTTGTAPSNSNPVGTSSAWVSSNMLTGTTAKVNLWQGSKNEWIISPRMAITANSRLKLKAAITNYNTGTADAEGMQGTDDKVNVLVSTDGCGTTWTVLYTFNAANTTNLTNVLQDFVIPLNAYTGQTIQIAFQATEGPVDNTPDYDFHIGNIVIEATPACDVPVLAATTNVTKNSATISWGIPTVGIPTGYQYVVSTTNTVPTGAGTATATNTVNLTGLAANTTYYVYVRTVCSDTFSDWSIAGTFTTLCNYGDVLTTTGDTICGQGTADLAVTVSPDAVVRWYTQATGGDIVGTQATYTTPEITETTNYYVSAGNVLPNTAAIVGNGGSTSSGGGNSPYYHGWGGVKTQYIIRASELQAAGIVAGPINSVSFTITTLGTPVFNNFALSIGTTTQTFATNTHVDGLTQVYSNAAQTLTLGQNMYMFTTPFVWDGTSNIVVQTCYSNVNTGGTSSSVQYDTTSFVSGTYTYTDNQSATAVCAATTGGVGNSGGTTTVSARPKMIFNATAVCLSPRVIVTATVTDAPAIAATASQAVICAGTSTTLNVTSENAGYTYMWMPGNLTGASQTVSPTATTTYTVTATDAVSGCVTEASIDVVVNPLPLPVTVTASSSNVCLNSVVTLSGSGGASAVPLNYCTITMSNGGASGDFLNNFSFANITNNNSGDAATDYTYYSALTANVTAGTPYTISLQSGASWAQGYRVWIDYNKDGIFTASESVYSSASASTAVQTGTITVPATAFNGVTRMRVLARYNNVPAAGDFCNNPGFGEYEDYNVNITGATDNVTFVWSPVAGLYTDAAATVAYTGQAVTSVFAKVTAEATYTATTTSAAGCASSAQITVTPVVTPAPVVENQLVCQGTTVAAILGTSQTLNVYNTATGGTALAATAVLSQGTYYVSQTVNGCESVARAAVVVTINVIPAPTVSPDVVTVCNAGTIADLTANGQNIKWYATATGGTELAATTAFTQGTTVYYASQTIEGCESSSRAAVAVQVNVTAAPSATAAQTFCNSATIADLTANGQNVTWYADVTGGTALTTDTALMADMVYYASQTVNGCESAERTAVTVTINTPAAPVADATEQTFCNSATVAGLTATGENLQWYTDATGGTALTAGTALMNGMTYYASQTINGCESMMRTAITVTITTVDAPAADDLLAFCYAATVADLTATGENLQWYTDAAGGEALAPATTVSDNLYYVSQTVNGCESTRTPVFVIVDLVAAPQGETTQVIEVTQGQIAMVGDITVNGVSVVWYATEADALAGTNPLSDETAIVSGNTYYAMQTIGECSSTTPLAVTVTTVLGGKDFDARSFSYYPNPVKDVLTISYSSDITSVAVYNLLGQEVITKSVNATQGTIDMSNLADGTYMVNVTSGNKVKTIKVVKKQ